MDYKPSGILIRVSSGGRPIAGTKLEVREQNGGLVDTFTTDATGTVQTGRLPAGHYDVSVILTPEGYSEKQGTQTVEVVDGEKTVCTFYLAASGTLTIHSQDTEGAALSGMTVVLMELNGTELGQYTSSSDGTIIINDLLEGVYKIKVTESPSDYALQSPEEQEVKIETEADVVFLYAKIYGLQITTICDETGARIPDAEYEIQKMGGKTVGYRKIAEGHESVNNYQYGLSTQALGLQSGEYVTDVRFEFGTVPANFALMDKMCYTQYILSTASNGSKSITRIEMGGQYNTVHLGTTHIDNGKNGAYHLQLLPCQGY